MKITSKKFVYKRKEVSPMLINKLVSRLVFLGMFLPLFTLVMFKEDIFWLAVFALLFLIFALVVNFLGRILGWLLRQLIFLSRRRLIFSTKRKIIFSDKEVSVVGEDKETRYKFKDTGWYKKISEELIAIYFAKENTFLPFPKRIFKEKDWVKLVAFIEENFSDFRTRPISIKRKIFYLLYGFTIGLVLAIWLNGVGY